MAASTGAVSKPRPYKRFLNSALHTRFVHAVCLTYICNLGIAASTSSGNRNLSDYFWSCFPLGPAGIKAALFCLSSLFVFILAVSTLSTGRRETPSNLASLRSGVFSYSTYATIFWYLVSAWWFCEAFVFTATATKELGWVIHGGYGAPDKLNERPIYLRLNFLLVALAQAAFHLYYDQSSLHILVTQPASPKDGDQRTHPDNLVTARLGAELPHIFFRSLSVSGTTTILCPFIYNYVFRNALWKVHVTMATAFVNIARSDARPPKGVYIGSIMGTGFFYGFLLCAVWQLSILFFQTCMVQEPTKAGVPLTASSKDPNGSLLTGITAKKDLVKTFAFWELAIIARKFPDRRKAIFAEFDRPAGPVWSTMLRSALDVISRIDRNITDADPEGFPPQLAKQGNPGPTQAGAETLPRLLPDSQKSDKSIFVAASPGTTRGERIGNFFKHEAQVLGQSPNPWSPPVDSAKKRLQILTQAGIDEYSKYERQAANTPFGKFMLTSPARKIRSAVLGNPIGNAAIIVDAIEIVTRMLVASLSEDDFGKAVAGVPAAVNQMAKTITMMEKFVAKNAAGIILTKDDRAARQDLKEVLIVHSRLKRGLQELLAAFQVFLSDVGLGIKDLNEARKAAEGRDLIPPRPKRAANGAQNRDLRSEGGLQEANRAAKSQRDSGRLDHRERQSSRTISPDINHHGQGSHSNGSTVSGLNRPGRLFKQLDPGYGRSIQQENGTATTSNLGSRSSARDDNENSDVRQRQLLPEQRQQPQLMPAKIPEMSQVRNNDTNNVFQARDLHDATNKTAETRNTFPRGSRDQTRKSPSVSQVDAEFDFADLAAGESERGAFGRKARTVKGM